MKNTSSPTLHRPALPSNPFPDLVAVHHLSLEADPTNPKHKQFTAFVGTNNVTDDWVNVVLKAFDKCSACRLRAPSTLCIASSWLSHPTPGKEMAEFAATLGLPTHDYEFSTEIIQGFPSCTAAACLVLNQLRAVNRRDSLESGAQKADKTKFFDDKYYLKSCAYCAKMFGVVEWTGKCGRCHQARYCDTTCQSAHWPFHGKHCTLPKQ